MAGKITTFSSRITSIARFGCTIVSCFIAIPLLLLLSGPIPYNFPLFAIAIDRVQEGRGFREDLHQYFKRRPYDGGKEFDLKHRYAGLLAIHHGVRPETHLLLQISFGEEFRIHQMLRKKRHKLKSQQVIMRDRSSRWLEPSVKYSERSFFNRGRMRKWFARSVAKISSRR
uniref:Uncharacterized protein n=1 Tax=Anopheles culicifacies TaxID=139723 RepID=A0A182MLJ6_9DIPT